jgi:hypothetical protein
MNISNALIQFNPKSGEFKNLTLQLEKSDLSVLEFLQLLFLRTKN